ncbi:MAG: sigma-70 family RNA polymerase sigma factor, partial [Eubacterium sp.]|nr:sigma-70 family RNA polymerase sigma factor [Eubacterium sp.]
VTEEEKKICTELWIEYASEMQKTCEIKLRGYESEVDDTIGDLYLALCSQIVRKGVPDNPKAWLYETLYHIINDKFRKKYKREKYIVDVDANTIALPCQHNFVEDIEKNEQLKKIEKIIPTYNKSEQTVMYNTYFDKHSMKDIAEKLCSTETAVKQKRYRLCRDLQKKLEEY